MFKVLTTFLLSVQGLMSSGQIILRRNTDLENFFPNTPLTTIGAVKSLIDCGVHCQQAVCMSIVYEAVQKICYLNNRMSMDISECSSRPNTTHYAVTSGVINGYDCDIIDDSCLKLLSAKLPWINGSVECASEGATLLNIDSSSKQLAIQQYMIDRGLNYVWHGLNDIVQEGNWVSQEGSDSPYKNFASGQPDNLNGQDCGIVSRAMSYMWDDQICLGYSAYVVCEIRKVG